MTPVTVDLHAHGPGFVPQPFRALWRAATPGAPAELGLGGADVVVACAVGDPIVTRTYLGRTPWQAVEAQLARIDRAPSSPNRALSPSKGPLSPSKGTPSSPTVLLGVEGADALAGDLDRVDAWCARGVRVVGLVHLGDNAVGTTCRPWQRYAGPLPVRRSARPGLTPFGVRVVERMNDLGMLVDVAHADRATVLGVVSVSTAPIVSSHSGARAVQDFPRYLTDEELRAIAGTGGLIGLWPYRHRRTGVADLAALVAHARHIADTVGPEHLAVGTDRNGVPGVATGFDPADLSPLVAALLDAGFSRAEVDGIVGGNAWQVLGRGGAPR